MPFFGPTGQGGGGALHAVALQVAQGTRLAATLGALPHARCRLCAADWDLGAGLVPQYRLVAYYGEGCSPGDQVQLLIRDETAGTVLRAVQLTIPVTQRTTGLFSVDSSGNGHNGAILGAPVLGAAGGSILGSAFGQSVSFAGVNGATADGLNCGDPLNWSAAGTLEVRGLQRGRSAKTEIVAGNWNTGDSDSGYVLYMDINDKLNGQMRLAISGQVNLVSSGAALTTSGVHDCALSWDGSTLRLFQDGALVGSGAAASYNTSASYPFTIGRDIILGTSANAFMGALDEIHVSSVARYTAAYTPASSPFTADANSLALYHMDSSGSGSPIAVTDPVVCALAQSAWAAIPAGPLFCQLYAVNLSGPRGVLLHARLEVRYA